MWMRRPLLAEACATPSSSSPEHHWTAASPVLHVESLILTARCDGFDKRKLFADRKRRPDEAPLNFGTHLHGQCREDWLRRAINQRISIAQGRCESDVHAACAGGPAPDFLRFRHIVGQALRRV